MKDVHGPVRPRLTREDQPVSFAELFFDLVFVFSVTQVVHLLHGAFDCLHLGRALLVFWLVWWAWTQYTWALNAADTRNHFILAVILIATVFAFFMAVTLPGSFSEMSIGFAISYVAVRCIGLALYIWVTWTDPKMRKAVVSFSLFSIAGMMAVIAGGIMGETTLYALWGLAILLDVFAASFGARSESWNLHPKHFAERHGLFVIIALGETLIVAASAAAIESWDARRMMVSMLAVGITSALWWTYFFRAKDAMEHAMAERAGMPQSELARDVYSLLHFPMVLGLIIYAYAIEEAMLHPYDAFPIGGRLALSLGLLLFSGTTVLSFWRATGRVLYTRLTVTIGIAAACFWVADIGALWSLALSLTGLIAMCVLEERLDWKTVRQG